MKIKHAMLVSAMLAASSVAMAQGSGGGGGGGPAGGSPSQMPGGAMARSADPASGTMSHSTKKMKSHKHSKKSAADMTNMPGANASSDTKGQ